MQSVRDDFGFAFTKFAFNEIVVIEILIGILVCGFGPAGGFVGTAFGAGGGAGRDDRATVLAVLGRFMNCDGHQPMPAYSSSVLRSMPINT